MRTGLIAKKVGMSRVFNSDGTNIPVTLLKVENCKVIEQRVEEKNGYSGLRLSYGVSKKNKINKPAKGFLRKNKIESSNTIREFRVSKEAYLNVGSILKPDHFVTGQFVDVSGFTIGKGFAGAMKRHNFSGNRATHGVSISHRSHGSTGQCQDPGKVFKGKKMAGRLGNVKKTMQNLKVINTDNKEGLIIVKGSVPGPKGLVVTICDSIKHQNKDLPYPTKQEEKSLESNNNNENNAHDKKDDQKVEKNIENKADIQNNSDQHEEKKEIQNEVENKPVVQEMSVQSAEKEEEKEIPKNEDFVNQGKDKNET